MGTERTFRWRSIPSNLLRVIGGVLVVLGVYPPLVMLAMKLLEFRLDYLGPGGVSFGRGGITTADFALLGLYVLSGTLCWIAAALVEKGRWWTALAVLVIAIGDHYVADALGWLPFS